MKFDAVRIEKAFCLLLGIGTRNRVPKEALGVDRGGSRVVGWQGWLRCQPTTDSRPVQAEFGGFSKVRKDGLVANTYLTQLGDLAMQAAGIADLGTSGTPGYLDLFSAGPAPPDRQAVIGDFTVLAYTGYAQQTAVFTGGFIDGLNGPAYALSGLITFAGPSSGSGGNALGWVLQNHAKTQVLAWGTFDNPIGLNSSTDQAVFVINVQATPNWGLTQVAP